MTEKAVEIMRKTKSFPKVSCFEFHWCAQPDVWIQPHFEISGELHIHLEIAQ